jgi:hypothetical protein
MSVELLVLVALFIVLPLIQQLIRAPRQQNQRFPEPAERRPPGALARTPPPELAVPPLPDTTPHAASDATPASARVPAPTQAGGPVTIALTPRRTVGQRTAVGLRTRRDLGRAIVLVAMLGPCRASRPYDWPEQAGRP